MSSTYEPSAFISKEIKVQFERPPVLSKRPDPPASFLWDDEFFRVKSVISRWFDYQRRGDMARNMQPHHLREAQRRGSWGVGRFYFRVETECDRYFDLYYDRAPEEAGDRQGHWFLWRELSEVDQSGSG